MKRLLISIMTTVSIVSCGIISVYPSLKFSEYEKEICVLTESFYLGSTRVSPVQKYPYEAYSTESTTGDYPFKLEEGSTVKVISIVNIDYGYGNYSRKARLEYFISTDDSIKFELDLSSYEKPPFKLKEK